MTHRALDYYTGGMAAGLILAFGGFALGANVFPAWIGILCIAGGVLLIGSSVVFIANHEAPCGRCQDMKVIQRFGSMDDLEGGHAELLECPVCAGGERIGRSDKIASW